MFYKPQKNRKLIFTFFFLIIALSVIFMVLSFILKQPLALLFRFSAVAVLLLCSVFVNNIALSEYTYSLEEREFCVSKFSNGKTTVLCRVPYGDIIDISDKKEITKGEKCYNYCQNPMIKRKLYIKFSENYDNNCVCIDYIESLFENISKYCPDDLR